MLKRWLIMLVPLVLGITVPVAASAQTSKPPVSSGLYLTAHESLARLAASHDPTGVCRSGTSQCWRDMPSGAVDLWPRDISGDPRQQFEVTYVGQANQITVCPAFGGLNIGVYEFIGYNDGFEAAGYFSGGVYWVGDQDVGGSGPNDAYGFWVWDSNGVLENCGDSSSGTAFSLQTAGQNYSQLWTSSNPTAPTWQQVHV